MLCNSPIRRCLVVPILSGLLVAWALPAPAQAQQESQKVIRRAQRPTFDRQDWDGVFFENLFRDGLVGERPENFGQPETAEPTPATVDGSTAPTGGDAWSNYISAVVIEDEVKKLQISLDSLISTPSRFRSENTQVRAVCLQLAFLFGVISEYDQNVRWQEYAPQARAAFARAAANARTNTDQAFNSVRTQKDNLTEMVRGGKFAADAVDESSDWADWTDRSPLMERMNVAFEDRLKPWTSNESEFDSHREEILHEASLLAALGVVLTKEGLDDADDDEYLEHARQLITASSELTLAARENAFDRAATQVNVISQSCSNCHESYR